MYSLDSIKRKLDEAGYSPLDILILGPTGVGKSTTINSLLNSNVAIVGDSPYPQTDHITAFEHKKFLRLWDSPGIGDSGNNDRKYINAVNRLINKTVITNRKRIINLIDLVLLIINGSSRDLSSTHAYLETISNKLPAVRILVGINFADGELGGKYWDKTNNTPDRNLIDFIKHKEESIIKRLENIFSITENRLVTYSAKYNYNIAGLINLIEVNIPNNPRFPSLAG